MHIIYRGPSSQKEKLYILENHPFFPHNGAPQRGSHDEITLVNSVGFLSIPYCSIERSSQLPSPSISRSSNEWNGIRAGLCQNMKRKQ